MLSDVFDDVGLNDNKIFDFYYLMLIVFVDDVDNKDRRIRKWWGIKEDLIEELIIK